MTTMIERAARALYEMGRPASATAEHWNLEWSELGEFDRAKYDEQARAVLMAVREEDDINDGLGDVYRAGFEAMFDAKFKDEYPMMSCGWEAMIDAILNEKDTTND